MEDNKNLCGFDHVYPCNEKCAYYQTCTRKPGYKKPVAPKVELAPVVHGRWEWFEEWNPSTTEHPAECEECGWRCSHCKTALVDVVGGYWDDPMEIPELKHCPNCGAKMDLEE